jgi:glycine/D-amino acid oxidase-like deaminating enzyme
MRSKDWRGRCGLRIVVVGAGIVGAAIGYYAARRGAEVTIVDAARVPGSGATGQSFAWIGADGDWPGGAAALSAHVLPEWRRLEQVLPDVRVQWIGSLDPSRAVWRPEDGALDPVAVTQALVKGAQEHGAEVVLGVKAGPLRLEGTRVVGVETSAGHLAADTVTAAAGTGTPSLCAPFSEYVPVTVSPAVLLRYQAPPGLVRTVISSPELEVRQSHDGQLLATAECDDEQPLDQIARRTTQRIIAAFGHQDSIRLEGAYVGRRPMPADRTPIIGPVPGTTGLYAAVMHSGVTLAPLVGRLVAQELVDGVEAPELSGCRPSRFG